MCDEFSNAWILRGPSYPKIHCAPVTITLEGAMVDTKSAECTEAEKFTLGFSQLKFTN